ncbi:hypothetical protein J6590_101305, partial [Homalodisca vitripennis]
GMRAHISLCITIGALPGTLSCRIEEIINRKDIPELIRSNKKQTERERVEEQAKDQ